ncbi:MAG: stage V sporulation protein AD [Clostridia bacterium]|nr:stage V sporulation protein AD [Clostridia bacterium]
MGQHTIVFQKPPKIVSSYTVVGPKESEGPLAEEFHLRLADDKFGENTFEKAERKMLEYAIDHAITAAGRNYENIDAIISGDLLNQIVSASFAARAFSIPFIGLYSACSTMSQSLAIGATLLSGEFMNCVVCGTGSHFASAERQYRFPLELGCSRPPCAQWTVTGAGACVLSLEGEGPKITMATFGKVIDYGVTDANNMGAAMAPAAADTLYRHFAETKRTADDYDMIVTGDLGAYGSKLMNKLMKDKGYPIDTKHYDCGEMIYYRDEDSYQGGSGAGCSAVTLCSHLYRLLSTKRMRIVFMATGALLSTITTQQGESVPAVSHLVVIESEGKK